MLAMLKKFKESQVTLFMIIGIVIVFIVFLALYLRTSEVTSKSGLVLNTETMTPINFYVTDCLNKVSTDAIKLLGYQGGYTNLNDADHKFVSGDLGVAYAYFDGNYELPSKEKIREQISDYIESNLNYCLNNFKIFSDKGYVFKEANVTPYISFTPDSIDIVIDYPFSVEVDGVVMNAGRFKSSIPVSFNAIYDVLKNTINQLVKDGHDAIPVNILANSGFDIDILPTDNAVIYKVMDNQLTIDNKRYVFLFATSA